MSIGPETWGPHIWKALHYVSIGYPENPTEEHKQKYKTFYLLLKDVLPCQLCRDHYLENLKRVPLTDAILSDREKLIKWVIDIHNVVNEMNDKDIMRYQEARELVDTYKCVHLEPFKSVTKEIKPIIKNTKSVNKKQVKFQNVEHFVETSETENTMATIYYLVGSLFALILIAVIYKKC